MKLDIKLHNEDLPDQLELGDNIAVDCEFMGLNVERDALCLVQISTGNQDAHIVKLNRETYNAPNLRELLTNKEVKKRMSEAVSEITHWAEYDYVIINDDLTQTLKKLRAILDAERLKRYRQTGLNNFVRKSIL